MSLLSIRGLLLVTGQVPHGTGVICARNVFMMRVAKLIKALHSPTIPCGVLVDSWSIPSISVHSQEPLGSPGTFPPHSQFIPGPFSEQGAVGMRKGEKGGGGECMRQRKGEGGGMECEGGGEEV
jgi:hypothetical protein